MRTPSTGEADKLRVLAKLRTIFLQLVADASESLPRLSTIPLGAQSDVPLPQVSLT
jgi:hypothetical protein